MSIEFNPRRWDAVKRNYRQWWAGDLERPLIHATLHGRSPNCPRPDLPWHYFNSFYDLSVPVEKIVDWYEYNLEQEIFLGDAFPHAFPNFGPGVVAAYMGAELTNDQNAGTTWFHPRTVATVHGTRLRFDPGSPWWRRTVELYRATQQRFAGLVQLDMTDLGGNLDIAATFRPGENLLLDLCDAPDEVERLAWEGHDAWWHSFGELTRTASLNPGYTGWCPIFSEEPSYMLQCDFSYMIGPRDFERFVLPELVASCRKLTNPFYHLDGPGQLPHLDLLLAIPELKGIQWVPGAGQPDITRWPDIYRRIRAAGKRIQFYAGQGGHGWEDLDILADQLGSAKGLVMIGSSEIQDLDRVRRLLDQYGCPEPEDGM